MYERMVRMRRVIFLVDMNAFFISCEITRNPILLGKPAAVAGNPEKRAGIILTANYEARKFGVKTAMVIHEALKLCPDMLLVPPDHNFYEQKSKEVMALLYNYTPVVEQNSIDEAWLDMTGCEGLFGKPSESAQRIMDNIKNKLGLWCSIGISDNKFLSKMASDMKKPLGITELWREDIQSKLWPLPIRNTYGIGKQTAEKLQSMGIETIGNLALFNKDLLVNKLGKFGGIIHQLANGIDPSPVEPHSSDEMKSISRSVTLPEDISDIEIAKTVLMKLSDEVGMTARKFDKKARKVQLTIKYSDFQSITRQATIPATYLTKEICSAGIKLLIKHWNRNRAVRLLGISLSGFTEDCVADQLTLFQLTETIQHEVKEEKLEKAIDAIRNKYGISKINRAVLLKENEKRTHKI
jgi:DNA polymerase-4